MQHARPRAALPEPGRDVWSPGEAARRVQPSCPPYAAESALLPMNPAGSETLECLNQLRMSCRPWFTGMSSAGVVRGHGQTLPPSAGHNLSFSQSSFIRGKGRSRVAVSGPHRRKPASADAQ